VSESPARTRPAGVAATLPGPLRVEAPSCEGPVLRTSRMLLRPLAARDREPFLRAAAASRGALAGIMPLHQNDESDEAMFQRHLRMAQQALRAAAPGYVRLIGILDDGQIAGGFNINAIARGLEWRADLNWWIVSPQSGRGLATEAVSAVVHYALADLPLGLGLHRLDAWITRENLASIRVAEKAGLLLQGDEHTYLSTGGRWVLHHLYTAKASARPG
jgi:[ribosomal protein S5]-alanine N-acetyltransferase